MKAKITTVSLLAVLLIAGAWAQDAPSQNGTGNQEGWRHGGFGGKHRGPGGNAFSQLNLTEDQKTRLHTLMQAEHQQALAVQQDTTLTPEQKREKMQQIHKDGRAQFQSVLTPEQQSQLSASREAGPRMGGARRGMGMGGPLGGLNLTDQQKSQMKPIFESAHQRMQSLRNDTSLTPEQKREQLKQLHQDTHTQMLAILTPEQQQQLQQQQHHRHGNGPPNGGTQPQS